MPRSRRVSMTSLTANGSPPRHTTWMRSFLWRSSSGRPRSSSGTRSTPQTVQRPRPTAYSASHSGEYFMSVAFDGEGHSVAAAETEGGDAAPQVAACELVEQRDKDA